MSSLGSASDRLRQKQQNQSKWADDMHRLLDEIDEIEAKAKPILESAAREQHFSAESAMSDALAMKKAAEEVVKNSPTVSPKPQQGSGGGEQGTGDAANGQVASSVAAQAATPAGEALPGGAAPPTEDAARPNGSGGVSPPQQ